MPFRIERPRGIGHRVILRYDPRMGKLVEPSGARRTSPAQRRLSRLQATRRELAARLQKIDAELSQLKPAQAGDRSPTVEELERWFADLSDGLPELPPLPSDFARADLYEDHD